jgi:alpha-1,2-rhamnosyltransferase
MIGRPVIYFDVTVTLRNGLNTGIQRVVKEVSQALPKCCGDKAEIRIVSSDYRSRDSYIEVIDNFAQIIPGTESLKTQTAMYVRKKLAKFRFLNPLFSHFAILEEVKKRIMRIIYKYVLRSMQTAEDKHFQINLGDIYLTADSFWVSEEDTERIIKASSDGAKIFLYIHDLIPLSHPDLFERHNAKIFTENIHRVMNLNPILICGSKFVFEEIKHFFPQIRLLKKIELASQFTSRLQEFNIERSSRKSILMLGTIEPRKNYLFVLNWMEIYGIDQKLVIIGRKGWKSKPIVRKIKKLERNGFDIKWFENASDRQVLEEVRGAKLGVCASIIEGYGLPLREFLQWQIPVVASDIPAFHDGLSPNHNVRYFDLSSLESLNAAIKNPKENGVALEFVPKTWQEFTEEVVDFILEAE